MSKINWLTLIVALAISLGLFGGLATAQDENGDQTPTPTEENGTTPEEPPEAGLGGSRLQ